MRLAVYCVASSSPSSSSADFSFLGAAAALAALAASFSALALAVAAAFRRFLYSLARAGGGRGAEVRIQSGCRAIEAPNASERRKNGIASERGGGRRRVEWPDPPRDDRGPRDSRRRSPEGPIGAARGSTSTRSRGREVLAGRHRAVDAPRDARVAVRIGRVPHLLESFSPGNSGYSFASGGAVGSDILTGGFSRTGSGAGGSGVGAGVVSVGGGVGSVCLEPSPPISLCPPRRHRPPFK